MAKLCYKANEKCKISENVQKLVLLNEIRVLFEMKLCFFWKIAKGSKLIVECNWNSKISQNFENLGFLIKKKMGFSKNLWFFSKKSLKFPNLHYNATEQVIIFKTFKKFVF